MIWALSPISSWVIFEFLSKSYLSWSFLFLLQLCLLISCPCLSWWLQYTWMSLPCRSSIIHFQIPVSSPAIHLVFWLFNFRSPPSTIIYPIYYVVYFLEEESQIDLIMRRRQQLKEEYDCKVINGESVAVQHRVLVLNCDTKCSKRRIPEQVTPKIKWWRLKEENIKIQSRTGGVWWVNRNGASWEQGDMVHITDDVKHAIRVKN